MRIALAPKNALTMKKLFKFGAPVLIILAVWLYARSVRVPQSQNEKVLVIASEARIKGFDPAQVDDSYSSREVTKVYEGLLAYHYLKRPHELVPNLAVSLPTVSEDGCVYTFTLQEGVRFHDNACFPSGQGRELVAEDFVYAMKRVADPKVRSSWFSVVAGKIKGLDAWRDKYTDTAHTDYSEAVEGLKVLDKYRLQFTLTQPWPQFLYILAMNFCCVVPREAVQYYGEAFLNNPVGTGPFTMEAFNPQLNKLVYYKNPTFRDKRFPSEASEEYQHLLADAGKKLPLVDKIITHIIPEEQPRWLKFQQGTLDVADIASDNIALEVIRGNTIVPQLQEKGVQLCLEQAPVTGFFAINSGCEPFKDNVKLRRALSLAFDGQRYNELFFNGSAVSAQSIIPPGFAGYQKDYVNPYRQYDLAKAKQQLAAAGYPEGKGLPVITLDVNTNTKQKQQCEFFQKCMEAIGVKIKVVPNIFPELLKKISQNRTMMHAISWRGDYPDAENFLQMFYKAHQSVSNGLNFNDAAYNVLYERATAMQPSEERTVLYEQLNRMIAEHVPVVYSIHQAYPVLYHGWVKNYLWSNYCSGIEQYIDIDLDQKKALQARF
jgi:oligopeptide transport system substrate-binding protein